MEVIVNIYVRKDFFEKYVSRSACNVLKNKDLNIKKNFIFKYNV